MKKRGTGKILIIDIETTGFLKQGGKIVEIGMVELNLSNGNKDIVFNHLVHEPRITVKEIEESWIVKNSSLNAHEIRYSPKLFDIITKVQNVVDNYPKGATAYNRNFDFDFLESRGIRFMKKLPDPMALSTDVVKIPSRHPSHGKYKWPTVEEAYKFFFPKSNYVEKHRGADDALHEADIVYALYKKGIFKLQ